MAKGEREKSKAKGKEARLTPFTFSHLPMIYG
jgi:hypothetical protein